MYRKVEIRKLDGSPWLYNFCDFLSMWAWITSIIPHALAETHGPIDYGEIEIREDNDLGDVLTVRGVDVGLLPVPGSAS